MSLNATYSRYQCMIIEFLVQHLHRKGRSRLFLGVCLGPGRSATWLRRPTGRSTNVEWLDQTPWCLTNQNDIYIYNGKHDHYTVYLESQCHKPAKLGDVFFTTHLISIWNVQLHMSYMVVISVFWTSKKPSSFWGWVYINIILYIYPLVI